MQEKLPNKRYFPYSECVLRTATIKFILTRLKFAVNGGMEFIETVFERVANDFISDLPRIGEKEMENDR